MSKDFNVDVHESPLLGYMCDSTIQLGGETFEVNTGWCKTEAEVLERANRILIDLGKEFSRKNQERQERATMACYNFLATLDCYFPPQND